MHGNQPLIDHIVKQSMSKNPEPDEILDETNSIQYGNLTSRYDRNNSMHTKSRIELLEEEVALATTKQEEEEAVPANLGVLMLLNESSRLNVRSLKLINKYSLTAIIERNRLNHIYCPFDEIVYPKLRSVVA